MCFSRCQWLRRCGSMVILSAGGSEVLNTWYFWGVSGSEVLTEGVFAGVSGSEVLNTWCFWGVSGSEVLTEGVFAGVSGSEVLTYGVFEVSVAQRCWQRVFLQVLVAQKCWDSSESSICGYVGRAQHAFPSRATGARLTHSRNIIIDIYIYHIYIYIYIIHIYIYYNPYIYIYIYHTHIYI